MAGSPKKNSGGVRGGPVEREFSAGFILYRRSPAGPVFLLLDYGKHWDYPKGHLEGSESAWAAATRELKEETGINYVRRIEGFEEKLDYFFHSPRHGRVHKTVTFFLGETKAEVVKLSNEHTGHAWLLFEDAFARLTYENAKAVLQKAHETLEQLK